MSKKQISVAYGAAQPMTVELGADRLRHAFVPPPPIADLPTALAAALDSPLEFPALRQAIVSGDRVVLVLDQRVPQGEQLVAGVIKVLQEQGVEAGDITIVQPADPRGQRSRDPRGGLSREVGAAVQWKVHDPTLDDSTAYLASTASGERIYLAREVLDSDFVMLIGATTFDPVLGFRGTGSAVYPGLSSMEAIKKAVGQGHDELGPSDSRPIRQIIDEIQWLMGIQFVVQVTPAADGRAGEVFAGQAEAVFHAASAALQERWQVASKARAELVIVGIDEPASRQSWFEVGSALDVARRLVSKDGRIVVLSQLQSPLSEGLEILRDAHKPKDAIKPLRERHPVDLIPATQIAQALDWANVYLLSRLPGDAVEDLCMVPLNDKSEAERLIEGTDDCIVIGAAQYVHALSKA
jgi:nickel-dependent lactate racemase